MSTSDMSVLALLKERLAVRLAEGDASQVDPSQETSAQREARLMDDDSAWESANSGNRSILPAAGNKLLPY